MRLTLLNCWEWKKSSNAIDLVSLDDFVKITKICFCHEKHQKLSKNTFNFCFLLLFLFFSVFWNNPQNWGKSWGKIVKKVIFEKNSNKSECNNRFWEKSTNFYSKSRVIWGNSSKSQEVPLISYWNFVIKTFVVLVHCELFLFDYFYCSIMNFW